MYLSWKSFLEEHEDKMEYNLESELIQGLINQSEKEETSFQHLAENPTLVVLSKSTTSDLDIQLTFLHHRKKKEVLSREFDHLALVGFGPTATAVKMNIKDLFRTSPKKHQPSFNEIMACSSLEDFMNLTPSAIMDENKLTSHAVLPPFLAEILIKEDVFSAPEILLLFIKYIRQLRKNEKIYGAKIFPDPEYYTHGPPDEVPFAELSDSEMETQENNEKNSESMNPEAENAETQAPTEENEEEANIPTPADQQHAEASGFDNPRRIFEGSYGPILFFLWNVIHHKTHVKGTAITPCNKPSTRAWSKKVHETHLKNSGHHVTPSPAPRDQNSPNFNNSTKPTYDLTSPDSNQQGFQNVATSFNRLSHVMEKKMENDIKAREEKTSSKKNKNYDNLSEIQKNTLILITAMQGQSDDDVPNMMITETMKTVLSQSIGTKVHAQLQYEFSKRGYLCDIGLGLCTALKNGAIASQPGITNINGLSPFFVPDCAENEQVTAELLMRIAEQQKIGKVDANDIKKITSSKIHIPQDFGSFLHFIKNFHLLISLLTGNNSIFSKSILDIVEHAEQNEKSYRVHHKNNLEFFPSFLDHIHRRCQAFIHSASDGLISSLKTSKIDFTNILESIEDFTYIQHTPHFLSSKGTIRKNPETPLKRPRPAPRTPPPRKKRRPKGDTVTNHAIPIDLKCPSDIRFGALFHPRNRKYITNPIHDDGTEKCNNWWHRGWCDSECPHKLSHDKDISSKEHKAFKKFLDDIMAKHKEWNRDDNNRQG